MDKSNIDNYPVEGISADEAEGLGLTLQELGSFPSGLVSGLSKELPELEPYFKALKGAGDHLQARMHVQRRDIAATKPAQVLAFSEDIETYEKEVDYAFGAIDTQLTEAMSKANAGLFSNQEFRLTELDKALLGDTLEKLKDAKSLDLMTGSQKYGELGFILAKAGYIELPERHVKMLDMHYSQASVTALTKLNEQSEVLSRIVREAMGITIQNKNMTSKIRNLQNRKLKS